MHISHHQVFFSQTHRGSTAALVLYDEHLTPQAMQCIAQQQGQAATAFIPTAKLAARDIPIRWFNNQCEIQRCGHASFAAACYIIKEQKKEPENFAFVTSNKEYFRIVVNQDRISLALDYVALNAASVCQQLQLAFDQNILLSWATAEKTGYRVILFSADIDLQRLKVDFKQLLSSEQRAVIALQLDDQGNLNFRYFAPQYGVNEDAATGSALSCIGYLFSAASTHVFANQPLQLGSVHKLSKQFERFRQSFNSAEFIPITQVSSAGAVMQFCCLPDSVLITGAYKKL